MPRGPRRLTGGGEMARSADGRVGRRPTTSREATLRARFVQIYGTLAITLSLFVVAGLSAQEPERLIAFQDVRVVPFALLPSACVVQGVVQNRNPYPVIATARWTASDSREVTVAFAIAPLRLRANEKQQFQSSYFCATGSGECPYPCSQLKHFFRSVSATQAP